MSRRLRPTVVLNCQADRYHMPFERIVEFYWKGQGGLISIRELNDGTLRVEVYRVNGDVQVLGPMRSEP